MGSGETNFTIRMEMKTIRRSIDYNCKKITEDDLLTLFKAKKSDIVASHQPEGSIIWSVTFNSVSYSGG